MSEIRRTFDNYFSCWRLGITFFNILRIYEINLMVFFLVLKLTFEKSMVVRFKVLEISDIFLHTYTYIIL